MYSRPHSFGLAANPRAFEQGSQAIDGCPLCPEIGTVSWAKKTLEEARKVALYLVPRLCDWTLQATAEYFGFTSYGGASEARAHIRRRRYSETFFWRKLERMEKQILQQRI